MNDENKNEKFNELEKKYYNYRWYVGILISIIIFLLTCIIYRKRTETVDVGDLISISSGLISIVLGIVAIILSISQNNQSTIKEERIGNLLETITSKIHGLKQDTQRVTSYIEQIGKGAENKLESYLENSNKIKNNENKKENNNISNKTKELIKNIRIVCGRGDIFLAEIYLTEIKLKVPVIVMQNDSANRYLPTVTIIPILDDKRKKLPTHIDIDYNYFSECKHGIACMEYITTIKKSNLIEKIDKLERHVLKEIDETLLIQFGIIEKSM